MQEHTRSAGLLLHISSLSGPHGIGTLGKEAFDFVDFLSECGFKFWQVLPLGPTGYGDSPYSPFSSFAGNSYFIDLNLLVQQKLLLKSEVDYLYQKDSEGFCDYGMLYETKEKILRLAYNRFIKNESIELCKNYLIDKLSPKLYNRLEPFFLFSVLRQKHNTSWFNESKDIKFRNPNTLEILYKEHCDDINFFIFVQYTFFSQYFALKEYANEKKVLIIGDLPFYSSYDSCDTWTNPKVFSLNEDLSPKTVGGCPPDAFSDEGQYWGTPTYNWLYLHETNYEYLLDRLEFQFLLFDVVRLDHFRGFESFWEIDASEKTAKNGKWQLAGGKNFFSLVNQKWSKAKIIAEDLGVITDEVNKLKDEAGYPGMNVLQFAFYENGKSKYLPHNLKTPYAVMYSGTHDNATLGEWFETESAETVNFAKQYLQATTSDSFIDNAIRQTLASICNLAIIPAQDFLHLGKKARMNFPGTTGNWTWRLTKKETLKLKKIAPKIKKLLEMYNRL